MKIYLFNYYYHNGRLLLGSDKFKNTRTKRKRKSNEEEYGKSKISRNKFLIFLY